MHSCVDFRRLEARLTGVTFIREPAVALDLLLKLDDGIENGLGSRRAAGNVDINRDDLVNTLHHVIRAIEAAACRARPHRNDPPRLSHLIVDLFQDWTHLVVDRAEDHKNVRLLRGKPYNLRTESRDVIVG
jgi:hypothetical protein